MKEGLNPVGMPDDPWRDSHPNLMAWLTYRSWDGLQPRQTARLSISPTAIGFVVTLSAFTEAQKVTVRPTHLANWADLMEDALLNGTGEWAELEEGEGAQRLKSARRKLLDAKDEND